MSCLKIDMDLPRTIVYQINQNAMQSAVPVDQNSAANQRSAITKVDYEKKDNQLRVICQESWMVCLVKQISHR